jgi:rubrerythrin
VVVHEAMTRTRTSNETERGEATEHPCAFCDTVFDASEQSTCPVCEAEVVLRGRR